MLGTGTGQAVSPHELLENAAALKTDLELQPPSKARKLDTGEIATSWHDAPLYNIDASTDHVRDARTSRRFGFGNPDIDPHDGEQDSFPIDGPLSWEELHPEPLDMFTVHRLRAKIPARRTN